MANIYTPGRSVSVVRFPSLTCERVVLASAAGVKVKKGKKMAGVKVKIMIIIKTRKRKNKEEKMVKAESN